MKKQILFTVLTLILGVTVSAQILLKDFNDLSVTSGGWATQSITGTQEWGTYEYGGEIFAKISGYANSQNNENEDWLISPKINLSLYDTLYLSFKTAMNYTGNVLDVLYSKNYSGTGNPNSATWNTITATLSSGSWTWTESGNINISSINDTAVYLGFKYTSTSTESSTWELDNIKISETPDTVSTANSTIASVQYTSNTNGDSPKKGQIVNLTGIVTASLAATGYFLQDNDSAWSGIYVYDNINAPAQGDSVSITGTVDEFNNFTEIKTVTSYTNHSSGNTIFTPIGITANKVNDEMYEGTLIRVGYATCDSLTDNYGVWKIKDGSGTCYVDDDVIFKNTGNSFDPTLNKTYIVIGPVSFSYGKARILPRNTSTDISDVTGISSVLNNNSLKLYPNPTKDFINISFSKTVNNGSIKILNLEGKLIYVESFVNNLIINTSLLPAGTYIVEMYDGGVFVASRKVMVY